MLSFEVSKIKKWVIFILVLVKINLSLQECKFNQYKRKGELQVFHEESDDKLRFLQSQPFEPIRIAFDYTTLDGQSGVTENQKSNYKLVLEKAREVFQTLIKVQRLTSLAKFSECDSNIKISPSISSTGVAADLVIFPFIDTTLTGNTEAYASACIVSGKNNRPVAGLVAFSGNFNSTKENWLNFYTSLAVHEFTHILIFNPEMYHLFIDSNGQSMPMESIMRNATINGLERSFIITPKVMEVAKKYFNCSNIIGVELENQGGIGTAMSHWEARVMLTDYMIGVSYDEMTISEITLAFFEDSGWYQANYFTGGLFRFGKHEGCSFLENNCINSNQGVTYPREYCNQQYAPVCTTGRTSKGFCFITDYTSIPSNYNYFHDNMGGLVLPDFCPTSIVPTNETAFLPWSCSMGFSQFPSELEETISSTSACFMSNLIKDEYMTSVNAMYQSPRTTCYQFSCNYNDRTLSVIIGSKTVQCPIAGGYVEVDGYFGKLECPDFNLICTNQQMCSNMIDCALNKVLPVNPIYNYTITGTNNETSANVSIYNGNYTVNANLTYSEPYNRPSAGSGSSYINYYLSYFILTLICLIYM